MDSSHRRVRLCKMTPRNPGSGGRSTLWAFGLLDLAALLGLKPDTVRKLVASGTLDPADLESIMELWHAKHCRTGGVR